jgi:D-serine deaminase-like pyridoxal phosphate-dependent protein
LANEMAAGSALVKPSDFDTPLLSVFQPASFIATPVLKVTQRLTVPGLEFANGLLGDPKPATCLFTHGGYWMASPVFPKRLEYSPNFGRSSNQDFLTGPVRLAIQPDDFVFLRPHQSEAVFLQFPRIVVYDGRRICDDWEPLPVSA